MTRPTAAERAWQAMLAADQAEIARRRMCWTEYEAARVRTAILFAEQREREALREAA